MTSKSHVLIGLCDRGGCMLQGPLRVKVTDTAPSAVSTQYHDIYQFLLLVTSSLVLPPYLSAQHPGRPPVTPIIHQPGAIDLQRYQLHEQSHRLVTGSVVDRD